MKKNWCIQSVIFFSIAILFCTTFLASYTANAEESYKLLEPSVIGGDAGAEVTAQTYFEGVFKMGLAAAIILAVLMLIIAGFEYTASGISMGNKEEAKNRIAGAIFGLIIALAAWLLLNEINPRILNMSLTFESLPEATTPIPGTGGGRGGGTTTTPPAGPDGKYYFIMKTLPYWRVSSAYTSSLDCQRAGPDWNWDGGDLGVGCFQNETGDPRKRLNTRIIQRLLPTINRGDYPCYDGREANCTTVAELRETAIEKVNDLYRDWGDLQITAGTEPYGHRAGTCHRRGGSCVDIAYTDQQRRFFVDLMPNDGAPWDGNRGLRCGDTITYNGGRFLYEDPNRDPNNSCENASGRHWHVEW